MNNKSNATRARTFGIQDVKQLIFTLAISSTLGFWTLFSNQFNSNQSAAAVGNNVSTGSVPPLQTEDQLVLNLPPIPTLIPPTEPSAVTSTPASSTPKQKPALQLSAPAKKVVAQANSKPVARKPAPVTKTSSSK